MIKIGYTIEKDYTYTVHDDVPCNEWLCCVRNGRYTLGFLRDGSEKKLYLRHSGSLFLDTCKNGSPDTSSQESTASTLAAQCSLTPRTAIVLVRAVFLMGRSNCPMMLTGFLSALSGALRQSSASAFLDHQLLVAYGLPTAVGNALKGMLQIDNDEDTTK